MSARFRRGDRIRIVSGHWVDEHATISADQNGTFIVDVHLDENTPDRPRVLLAREVELLDVVSELGRLA